MTCRAPNRCLYFFVRHGFLKHQRSSTEFHRYSFQNAVPALQMQFPISWGSRDEWSDRRGLGLLACIWLSDPYCCRSMISLHLIRIHDWGGVLRYGTSPVVRIISRVTTDLFLIDTNMCETKNVIEVPARHTLPLRGHQSVRC